VFVYSFGEVLVDRWKDLLSEVGKERRRKEKKRKE